jgi:tetratricopeptide (TPR) repeat protein
MSVSSNQQGEYLEIILVDEGMALGSSLVFGMLGGTSIEKLKLVARVFSSNGSYDLTSASYTEAFYGQETVGLRSKDGNKALNQLDAELRRLGWQQTGVGSQWFSYQYQRRQQQGTIISRQDVARPETEAAQREATQRAANQANNEGLSLYYSGQFEAAVKAYDRAISLDPSISSFHTNKAGALHGLNREELALKSVDEAIRLDPATPNAHIIRVAILATQGKYKAALEAIDTSLRQNSSDANAHRLKGEVLELLGLNEDALREIDEAILLDFSNEVNQLYKGKFLYNLGQYQAALKSVDVALRLNSEYKDALELKN